MPSDIRILDLADLAAGQWGLFTMAQARELDLSAQQVARLANSGAVERLRHGVYRISGAPSAPDEQLRAAWLMIDPRKTAGERLEADHPAIVSRRSAAQLHDLGDLDADVMEFATSRRRQSRLSDVRYHVQVYASDQWTLVGGLPVTTVLVTIAELAADQLDGGHLAGIIRDALTTNRADADEVSAVLRPYAHRYGAALGDGSGLLDRFLAEAGIPKSTRALGQHLASQGALDLTPVYQKGILDAFAVASNPGLDHIRDAFAVANPAVHQVLNALQTIDLASVDREHAAMWRATDRQ
ncbi:type IV toxin-antitoxin system AbiEi family antitoxin domain-containing protein [Rhodococcus sp. NPDC059968]|uniref:type IV toxin-antitoxin system AbiEi family antitoxin domain-containing protein n=1 Tax=Rhodococcus sp. NPDC059968 TaxID=3347017 RepID=UPI00366BDE58